MQFASILLLSALTAASPVYKVEMVTVTKYTTVNAGYDAYTSAFPEKANPPCTKQAAAPAGTVFATTTAIVGMSPDNTRESSIAPPPVFPATPETDFVPAASEYYTPTASEDDYFSAAPEDYISAAPKDDYIPVAPQGETAPVAAANTQAANTPTGTTSSATKLDLDTTAVFTGRATYYNAGMGACGHVNVDTDFIVAVGDKLYEKYTPSSGNPNLNTLCGSKLVATYEGKSVEVTVVDRCGSCLPNDLDLSPIAFSQIADQGLGHIQLTWKWV